MLISENQRENPYSPHPQSWPRLRHDECFLDVPVLKTFLGARPVCSGSDARIVCTASPIFEELGVSMSTTAQGLGTRFSTRKSIPWTAKSLHTTFNPPLRCGVSCERPNVSLMTLIYHSLWQMSIPPHLQSKTRISAGFKRLFKFK